MPTLLISISCNFAIGLPEDTTPIDLAKSCCQRVFGCENLRRYSRERASQRLFDSFQFQASLAGGRATTRAEPFELGAGDGSVAGLGQIE